MPSSVHLPVVAFAVLLAAVVRSAAADRIVRTNVVRQVNYDDFSLLCADGIPLLMEDHKPRPCQPRPWLPEQKCPTGFWCHEGELDASFYCCPRSRRFANRCHLPPAVGYGKQRMRRFYFDWKTDACHELQYSGIGGNENSFMSYDTCETQCRGAGEPPISLPSNMKVIPKDRKIPYDKEKPIIEAATHKVDATPVHVPAVPATPVAPAVAQPTIPPPHPTSFIFGAFLETTTSVEEARPSEVFDPNPCNLPPDRGVSGGMAIKMWYFDMSALACVQFTYGGKGGNSNRFSAPEDCTHTCGIGKPTRKSCELPPAIGDGPFRIPRFYFDQVTRKCERFFFSGTDGNDNRFYKKHKCERLCLGKKPKKKEFASMPATTTPQMPSTMETRQTTRMIQNLVAETTAYPVFVAEQRPDVVTVEPFVEEQMYTTADPFPTLIFEPRGETMPGIVQATNPPMVATQTTSPQLVDHVFSSLMTAEQTQKVVNANANGNNDNNNNNEQMPGELPRTLNFVIETVDETPLGQVEQQPVPMSPFATGPVTQNAFGLQVEPRQPTDFFFPNPPDFLPHQSQSGPVPVVVRPQPPQVYPYVPGANPNLGSHVPVVVGNWQGQQQNQQFSSNPNPVLSQGPVVPVVRVQEQFNFTTSTTTTTTTTTTTSSPAVVVPNLGHQPQQTSYGQPYVPLPPTQTPEMLPNLQQTMSGLAPVPVQVQPGQPPVQLQVNPNPVQVPILVQPQEKPWMPNPALPPLYGSAPVPVQVQPGAAPVHLQVHPNPAPISMSSLGQATNQLTIPGLIPPPNLIPVIPPPNTTTSSATEANSQNLAAGPLPVFVFPSPVLPSPASPSDVPTFMNNFTLLATSASSSPCQKVLFGDATIMCAELSSSCPIGTFCQIGDGQSICCPILEEPPCDQQMEVGLGGTTIRRWFFDQSTRFCHAFGFKGFKGNQNNFGSFEECRRACGAKNVCINGDPILPNNGNIACTEDGQCGVGHTCIASLPNHVCCPISNNPPNSASNFVIDFVQPTPGTGKCDGPIDGGHGDASEHRWAFDGGECVSFIYRGLGGGTNNFLTRNDCESACSKLVNAEDGRCKQVVASGHGEQYISRYFYSPEYHQCLHFIYSGEGGNANNFESLTECLETCVANGVKFSALGIAQNVMTSTFAPLPQPPPVPQFKYTFVPAKVCPQGEPIATVDGAPIQCDYLRNAKCPGEHVCTPTAAGGAFCCPSPMNYCLQNRPALSVCTEPNFEPIKEIRFTYDPLADRCIRFSFANCAPQHIDVSLNNFVSSAQCSRLCCNQGYNLVYKRRLLVMNDDPY